MSISKKPSFWPARCICIAIAGAFLFPCLPLLAQGTGVGSQHILIDQIGYRPQDPKWAVVANPVEGFNKNDDYQPGTSLELRRVKDGSLAGSFPLVPWKNGQVDPVSGDQVWQADFSRVQETGSYYLVDPATKARSFNFDIHGQVFRPMLDGSIKSFFYQRCGIEIQASHGGKWTHPACHTDTQQNAWLFDLSRGGLQDESTARNISGGWHDAGDYRKYASWMSKVVWDLITAWEWWPASFGDTSGIPESGNGVPDVLDEVKWELDWLLRMQREDGALYSGAFVSKLDKGSVPGQGDPSREDTNYVYPGISTTATSSGAISFALGSRVFREFGNAYPGYHERLEEAARRAWQFLDANPAHIPYDHSGIDNADANMDDQADFRMRVAAAAELFRLTGNDKYREFFDQNYKSKQAAAGNLWVFRRFEAGSGSDLQRGMVSYCLAKGASPQVVETIRKALAKGVDQFQVKKQQDSAYRSYTNPNSFYWGSNGHMAEWGMMSLWAEKLEANPESSQLYRGIASEYLHYFHGRNPLNLTYLTQASLFGAERHITQIYHTWFHDGTVFDKNPAPGILSGGPNKYFKPSSTRGKSLSPPMDQPAMKSYLDWNTSWPENSWEITENSTGYQSRYCFLLAAFAQP